MPQCSLAPLDGVPDRAQQHVITVSRDEDDWHVGPFDCHPLLQLKTVKAWKRYVQYKAARNERSWAGKEFLCQSECLGLPALGADQQLQRFAHRDVIVNNKDDWCGVRFRWWLRLAGCD